jgi:peptidoglycan/LPS O-acetylase OafA/YrhL
MLAKTRMGDRNETVDMLRALAALAVCLFHFTRFDYFTGVSVIEPICRYGSLGVEVFFVTSGFIVPYAMQRGGYTLRAWPTFMWKRLLRLEPPYLVSIALVLVLDLIALQLKGPHDAPLPWDTAHVASHVGYLTGVMGFSWLNPVYWTLAIELQFYLLCSLIVPMLVALERRLSRIAIILALAVLPLLLPSASELTLLPYLRAFALGLLTFLATSELITRGQFWFSIAALAALVFATLPLAVAFAGIATALVIACVRLRHLAPIAWLATLSYSLYLVHVPIGGRLVTLGARLPTTAWLEIVLVILALAASLGAAYALYVAVERPSRLLAGRLQYPR